MELGIYTFAETTPDPRTGRTVAPRERLRDLLEEIELADELGLDVSASANTTGPTSPSPRPPSSSQPPPRARSASASRVR